MHILTVNSGSSSLKAALYRIGDRPELEFAATATRVGRSRSSITIRNATGDTVEDRSADLPDHSRALRFILDWLDERVQVELDAFGHRVVHGGQVYCEPVLVTPAVVETLRDLVPIDPTHLPQAIAAIELMANTFPRVPQVACFDTAFHRTMPAVAQAYALPTRITAVGVIRYGFHGLSYEYIMQALRTLDRGEADGRVVIAHLGNGASMAAVQNGRGIDTTMGFTPTGGLVMGTRSGDLDPGVLLYLLQGQKLEVSRLSDLLNRESGLLGVSGSSADMHDLLEREGRDERAALAVELFCYQARKYLGALVAVLGGLDTVVFTGGIGERAAPIRTRICAGLEFLAIELDETKNAGNAAIISSSGSGVRVRVVPTDEDLMIAQHTQRLVSPKGSSHVSV